MITHIVLFKFHDADPATLAEARQRILGLDGRVPSLRGIEVGVDILRSPRSYDLGLIARFDDMDGLQAYQVHPDHQQVAQFLRSVSTSVAVDYES